ncbi:MAG: PilZ domain-containing protein [Planctomycetes bacterium]|nr:PilZ domain-containing protein [Planctomycetota bacterium]
MDETKRKDKRQVTRIPVRSGSGSFRVCHFLFKGRSFACELLDLNKGGARIRSGRKLKPGQELDLQVSPGSGVGPIKVQAIVKWCQTGNQKKYQAGIQFEHFMEGSYDRLRRFETEHAARGGG